MEDDVKNWLLCAEGLVRFLELPAGGLMDAAKASGEAQEILDAYSRLWENQVQYGAAERLLKAKHDLEREFFPVARLRGELHRRRESLRPTPLPPPATEWGHPFLDAMEQHANDVYDRDARHAYHTMQTSTPVYANYTVDTSRRSRHSQQPLNPVNLAPVDPDSFLNLT